MGKLLEVDFLDALRTSVGCSNKNRDHCRPKMSRLRRSGCTLFKAEYLMSKSMVEKYEQALMQDPSSTIFVELAKAYLDKGETAKAAQVCQNGLTHHPNSVVGRVLWGKALINAGKAADAMKQFDMAVSIDRNNPHAYNLIGEALLRKGLFRSALPILRKAAVLQPNDGRIAQWLEQTKNALAGGPAPVLYDSTRVDLQLASSTDPQFPGPQAPAQENERLSAQDRKPEPRAARESSPARLNKTAHPPEPRLSPVSNKMGVVYPASRGSEVALGNGKPQAGPRALKPAVTHPASPVQTSGAVRPNQDLGRSAPKSAVAADTAPSPVQAPMGQTFDDSLMTGQLQIPPLDSEVGALKSQPPLPISEQQLEALPVATRIRPKIVIPPPEQPKVVPPSQAQDPFDLMMEGMLEGPETLRGLTATFDALAESAVGEVPVPILGTLEGPPVLLPSENDQPTSELRSEGPPSVVFDEPAESDEWHQERNQQDNDLAFEENDLPTREFQLPDLLNAPLLVGRQVKVEAPRSSRPSLLADIPDEAPAGPIIEVPRVEPSPGAAEAIAREYEQELRAKLEVSAQQKTFLQRHGAKMGVALGALVVASGLVLSFSYTRNKNQGLTLDTALAKGLTAMAADTKEQYQLAIKSFDQALSMDGRNTEALALKGFAHAVLYAEHGQAAVDKEAALQSLTSTAAVEARPDVALVVQYFLDQKQESLRQQVLSSDMQRSMVQAQAGRMYLDEQKYEEALAKLKLATELDPRNTRAMVALGDYYLRF
jgi:cellulose synthase operon protein C